MWDAGGVGFGLTDLSDLCVAMVEKFHELFCVSWSVDSSASDAFA